MTRGMTVAEHHEDHHGVTVASAASLRPGKARDPVCGMTVDVATSKDRAESNGVTHYFCSAGCRTKFIADPAKYMRAACSSSGPPSAKGHYLYVSDAPANPTDATGQLPDLRHGAGTRRGREDSGPSAELTDMTRRFWIGTVLAVPMLILEMGAHFPGLNLHHFVSPQTSIWTQFAFGTPVVLWAGWPFFQRGWASLRNRSLNMFSLIALGVGPLCSTASSRPSRPGSFL